MGATPRVWEKRKKLELFMCRWLSCLEEGSHWAGTQTHRESAWLGGGSDVCKGKQWGQLCKYWKNCELEPNEHCQSEVLLPWWRNTAWERRVGAGVRGNDSVPSHSSSLAVCILSLGQHPQGSHRQSRPWFRESPFSITKQNVEGWLVGEMLS